MPGAVKDDEECVVAAFEGLAACVERAALPLAWGDAVSDMTWSAAEPAAMRASASLGSEGARVFGSALVVAWNAAVAAATAAEAAVSLATESTDPAGLTEAGDDAEEVDESAAEVAADAEGRVASGALAKAGDAADIAAVADVPDASEAPVPRAWSWSFA